jgi:hypothetical protein
MNQTGRESDPLQTMRHKMFAVPPMLYPDAYVWMIFFATLDVILTALVLTFDGAGHVDSAREINPVARAIIEHWQMAGAMIFKYALVMLAIVICETVGRNKPTTGVRLAWTCVLISAFPVVWSLTILLMHRLT